MSIRRLYNKSHQGSCFQGDDPEAMIINIRGALPASVVSEFDALCDIKINNGFSYLDILLDQEVLSFLDNYNISVTVEF